MPAVHGRTVKFVKVWKCAFTHLTRFVLHGALFRTSPSLVDVVGNATSRGQLFGGFRCRLNAIEGE